MTPKLKTGCFSPVNVDTALQIHSEQPDRVTLRLTEIVDTSQTAHELYEQLVDWLTHDGGCVAAGILMGDHNGNFTSGPHNFTGPAFEADGFRKAIFECASQSTKSGVTTTTQATRIRNVVLVGLPVMKGIRHSGVTRGRPRSRAIDVFVAAIKIPCEGPVNAPVLAAAAWAVLWHTKHKQRIIEERLNNSRAILDLISVIKTSDSLSSACDLIANRLQQKTQATAASIALCNEVQSIQHQTLCTATGHEPLLQRAIHAEDVLRDLATEDRMYVAPTETEYALPSLKRLCRAWQVEQIIGHGLFDEEGKPVGAWLLAFEKQLEPGDRRNVSILLRNASRRIAQTFRYDQRAIEPIPP